MRFCIHLFLAISFLPVHAFAQVNFYRIKTDFSIKEKQADGQFSLQLGTVYYDINKRKLLYDLSFPSKGKMLITDKAVYAIDETQVDKHLLSGNIVEHSIFHLCLTNSLKNFGLDGKTYDLAKVERDGGMVITTWQLKKQASDQANNHKIITSIKDRQLYGVVFLDGNDNVISKQFYKDYEMSDGLAVPTKVIFITYLNGEEQYKIMELKTVLLNETDNDAPYDFPLPTTGRN